MRKANVGSLVLLGWVFCSVSVAQVPLVRRVVNQASLDGSLAPGVPALVSGSNFRATATVSVGGLPGAVLDYVAADPEHSLEDTLLIQIPVELEPGQTVLVVTTSAGTSEPFGITLQRFAPAALGFMTADSAAPMLFTCYPLNTATPGNTLTLAAVGLGPTNPMVPTGMTPGAALATTTLPIVRIDGQEVEVLESVLSPDQLGVYWVTFRAPIEDGSYEFALSAGGVTSPRVPLPVGRALQNITAVWRRTPAAAESIQILQACGTPFIGPTVPGSLTNDPSFVGDGLDPGTTLGGVTVEVTDANGVGRLAPLFFVSPVQINYLVPAGTADGVATVTMTNSEGDALVGRVQVQRVAPALLGTALVVRLRDGVQTVETVFPPIEAGDGISFGAPESENGLPIDPGPETDVVYLVLFGTGLRNFTSAVRAFIGGVELPTAYAGAQNQFVGLDQVNLPLPQTVGRGEAELLLTVDGVTANIVYLVLQYHTYE